MQVRQYKKDFDASRKALVKAEENYTLEKNKEMLFADCTDVFHSLIRTQINLNLNSFARENSSQIQLTNSKTESESCTKPSKSATTSNRI